MLDAFRAVVKEIGTAIKKNGDSGENCFRQSGVLAFDSGAEMEFFYLDDPPGETVLGKWLRRFQLARINALPSTAAGD